VIRVPARVPLLVWLVSFAVYAAYFQGQWVYGERPIYSVTGDEPHYLTIATSLLKDGDLDVLNNYRDKDYFAYYPYHLGDPRSPEDMHALYGRGGRLYSKHGLGLPLLLLPAMRLGGAGVATVFMMAVTALLAVQLMLLALDVTGHWQIALLAWLGVAFSPPLLLYAPLFYPEIPGALLTVIGTRAALRLWREPHVPRRTVWRSALVAGLAIGFLPWLHLRYIPLSAVVALAAGSALLWRGWRWQLGTFMAPVALLGIALLGLDWRLFGGVPAVDEYGTVSFVNLLVGAPGLLFDRQFGLLPYSPLYVVALYGLLALPRALGRSSVVLVAPLVIYSAFIASFSFWYGAFSPPARMLVPILPLLAAPLAAALARWPLIRWVYAGLLALTGALAHLLMDVPRLRYSLPTGASPTLEYLSAVWKRDLSGWLPSFIVPSVESYAWAGVAIVVAAAVLALTRYGGSSSLKATPIVEGGDVPSEGGTPELMAVQPQARQRIVLRRV
jgi:hypothetical protein